MPSAKLGTVAVVSNTIAASTSKSLFMVLVLFGGNGFHWLLCPMQLAAGQKPFIPPVFGKSKFWELVSRFADLSDKI